MRRLSSILYFLLFFTITGVAQIPYQETVPDIRYPVCGQKKLSKLSNDDGLFTILAFEDEAAVSRETDRIWYTNKEIQPFFQNYNPDYGRTLFIVSKMRGKKRLEKRLGVTSYPEFVLVGPDLRILTRSHNAEDIIKYVTTNLSYFAETDWEGYILKARDLFESGQEFAAQRIVSDCLRHGRWSQDFSLEAHKAIPIIVASMERDEMYSFYVGEIKYRFNLGILSEEDVAPFKSEFSRIHMTGDKDL